MKSRRGVRQGAARSLFGNPGLAQAFEIALKPSQPSRVVAHRRPSGAGAGDSEGGVEREASIGCGMRFFQSTELREGGGQPKICQRIVSVRLDRPSTPHVRLLPTAEVELRDARGSHPDVSQRIAWTKAQGLLNVSLCFFGATD